MARPSEASRSSPATHRCCQTQAQEGRSRGGARLQGRGSVYYRVVHMKRSRHFR